jgi:hypothetical protein
MAVVRARSSPPYALIVFVFLTVIATGIAIWLGVGKGDAEKRLEAKDKELVRLKKASDEQLVNQLLTGRTPNDTAMFVAGKHMNDLKTAILSDGAGKTPEEVILAAQAAITASGKSNFKLVGIVQEQMKELKTASDQVATLRQQLKTVEDQAAQLASSSKTAADAAQTQINQLKEQLTAATNAGAQERKEKEENATSAQGSLTKAREEAEAARRQLVLQNEELTRQLAQANETIKNLRNMIQKSSVAMTEAIAPAGKIVRAPAGTGEVYIDLGRRDKIVAGMTFSVHDARTGVRGKIDDRPGASAAMGDLEAAGKGGIEVIDVREAESLCRITRVAKDQTMQVGDLIANPVYQNTRNRKSRFVVIGEFDLDNDGVSTAAERDRVTNMITSWGGTIDTAITPQTDFLIAGSAPAAPSAKMEDQPGGVGDQRAKLQKDYDEAVVEAKRSSVPILNVNRFLALIGYYNTSIVR